MTLVEVRDGEGRVLRRTIVEALELSIGRASDNTVVVEDDFTDAHHCVVTLDPAGGAPTVRDLGTMNGTVLGDTVLRETSAPFGFSQPIRIGGVTVVLLRSTGPVAEAREEAPSEGTLLPYDRLPARVLAPVAAAAATVLAAATSHEPWEPVELVGVGIVFLLLIMLWAGAWALGARLAAGSARFGRHVAFSSLFLLVVMPLAVALSWLAFVASSPVLDVVVTGVFFGFAFWTALLFGHLDVASVRSRRRKLGWAVGSTAAFFVLALGLAELGESPTSEVAASLRQVYPAPAALTRSAAVGDFLERLTDVEETLADEAEEELAKRPYPQ